MSLTTVGLVAVAIGAAGLASVFGSRVVTWWRREWAYAQWRRERSR